MPIGWLCGLGGTKGSVCLNLPQPVLYPRSHASSNALGEFINLFSFFVNYFPHVSEVFALGN